MSLGKLLKCQWIGSSGISFPKLTLSWAATDAPIHNNTNPQLFFGALRHRNDPVRRWHLIFLIQEQSLATVLHLEDPWINCTGTITFLFDKVCS